MQVLAFYIGELGACMGGLLGRKTNESVHALVAGKCQRSTSLCKQVSEIPSSPATVLRGEFNVSLFQSWKSERGSKTRR